MFKGFWPKILELNQRYFFDFFIVTLLAIIVFAWLQSTPTLPEPDSFYHAKMAVMLGHGQLLQHFPWLSETNFPKIFVDQHFLYHLLLVPFVFFLNPLMGVKLATIIFSAGAVLLIYWFFKKFKVKWPFLFIIVLLSSQPWLFRAGLVKAPVVLLSFLILSFYFLTHQRYKSLAALSFLAVWLYIGWPLLPILVVSYLLVTWFLERIRPANESLWHKVKDFLRINKNRVIPWPAAIYCFLGIMAGLVINPYFPYNLFSYQQQFKMALINYQSVIGVGGEWYPYGLLNLISDAPLVCALLAVCLLLFVLTFKKQSIFSWTWLVLAAAFFVLTLKSRRNVEFFVPFAVIFSAFTLNDYFRRRSFIEMKILIKDSWQRVFAVIFLIIGLGFAVHLPQDLLAAKKDMANGWPLTHYQKAAFWLKNNTPKGSIVFNADWDDFTFLFYHNTHNYYLTGLDPTFMYEKNQDRYWQYVDVTLGKQRLDLKKTIKGTFGADYVFLDNQHQTLENNLKASPDFGLVYQDEESRVFKAN